jgi:ribosomal protein L13E
MKSLLILSMLVISSNVFSETKAVKAVVPASAKTKKVETKTAEVPCDSKEDVLKKLEEKKKAQAEAGKGFSLQGAKDTGCSI